MSNSSENEMTRRTAAPWPRKVSHTHVFVALGLLAAFVLIFYLAAVYPLEARAQEQQAVVAALQQQIAAKTSELKKLRIITEKVEKARTEGDSLLADITLDHNTRYSRLLGELVSAAADSKIEARETNFSQEPIEGATQYGAITITANFRGEYDNLVRFLNRLDKSDHFLIIESLAATPRSDSSVNDEARDSA